MYEIVKDLGLGGRLTCALESFIKTKKLDITFKHKQRNGLCKVRTMSIQDVKKIIARVEQGIRDKESFTLFSDSGYIMMYKKLKSFIERVENE